jgi:RNA polymerase sigma-70 factor, ECF subfamily
VPENPGAWLTTAARNRAVDVLRRQRTEGTKYEALQVTNLATGNGDGGDSAVHDDRLRLIFTCCHPFLSFEAQVALALRTLLGLTAAEIAHAFFVSEQTMTKRLVRARAKIREAQIPYRVPPDHLLPERTVAVLGALYLLFNEGYNATEGTDLIRADLCLEAIRLARLVSDLMPDEPESLGLLALMLLHEARRPGRSGADGMLVPLEDQDRALWNRTEIAEGCAFLESALRQGRPGPYQLQGAIAACHATASSASTTDWEQITLLYERLHDLAPSPVVELNRAVAVGMWRGAAAGLEIVHELSARGELAGYHLLEATRADFLRRLGRNDEAAKSYQAALEMVGTESERRYLGRRLVEVTTRPLD